jgi:hypothetical protein
MALSIEEGATQHIVRGCKEGLLIRLLTCAVTYTMRTRYVFKRDTSSPDPTITPLPAKIYCTNSNDNRSTLSSSCLLANRSEANALLVRLQTRCTLRVMKNSTLYPTGNKIIRECNNQNVANVTIRTSLLHKGEKGR